MILLPPCFSDGRGFIIQRHDAGGPARGGQGDVEGAMGREEREVSSAQFALVWKNVTCA